MAQYWPSNTVAAIWPEPPPSLGVFSGMRIREDNRNMVLLAAVVAVTIAISGMVVLFEPATAKQEAMSPPAYLADSTPVRVVGAPFVPNVDPHRR